jgi:hypothetical protein
MQAKLGLLGAGSFAFISVAAAQTTPPMTQQPGELVPPAQSQPTPGQIAPVTPADLKVGAKILATDGSTVGTIETVASDGVVIATGKARVQVPSTSIGKDERGLIIALTRAELEAAAAKEPLTR